VETRTLGGATGGLRVSALGLGCMGMSWAYGNAQTRDETEAIATLHAALDVGVTFIDTAEVYGPWTNEQLVGRALAGRRDRAVIATKFGFRILPDGSMKGTDGSPDNARRACDESLRRLGVDVIDLWYLHRVDEKVPIEDTVGAMAEMVRAGKVRHLGLSEAGATTLRRAAAVHRITALQSEWSLWERGIEQDVVPTCRELGIGIVPYSPLGRGFLTGQVRRAEEYASEGDYRSSQPRFQGENFDRNMALVETLKRLAAKKGCTPAQLALAWLLAQGPDVVPIPGTKSRARLAENAAAADVKLASCDLMALEEAFPRGAAAGLRYAEAMMKTVNR
jgi:aryl-alcohol dehydrogenase-like predicted oxidoreductase